jgi:beta-lactamase regulating signal transducer with metallopeptidase domain
MIWNSFIDADLINALGWALIHSMWQIATVSLLLWITMRCLPDRDTNIRYCVSVLALSIGLIFPAITFLQIRTSQQAEAKHDRGPQVVYDDERSTGRASKSDAANDDSAITDDDNAPLWAQSTSLENVGYLASRYSPVVFPYAIVTWLLGIALLSFRIAGGLWQLKKYRRDCGEHISNEWDERFRTICERLGVKGSVELISSQILTTPVAVGIFRPVIIVPCALFLQVDPRQLETVIAHELIHIRRYDPLINLLQAFIETILFYHPCMWWISKQVRKEREFATDAAVLATFGESRLTYAAALASLEEIRLSTDQTTTPWLAATANGGNLMNRIKRILNEKTEISYARSAWSAVLASILISGVLLTIFSFTSSSSVNAQRIKSDRKLAIGFVSIPPLDRSSDPPKDSDATARLLITKLQQLKIPAIGFVNGSQISDGQKLYPVRANIIRSWRDAGLEVGIGSFKHVSFYNTPYDDYVAAVEKNENVTKKLLDEKNIPIRYFSYPYLNTGKNADDRDRFEQWLNARGVRSVKYTIDNNEWMYSYAYDMARNDNDVNTMNEIRSSFVHYMTKMFDHYEAYSKEMFGREIAQTMVLTPSRLVTDSADDLFGMIRGRGYRFVSMDDALSDEAYKTPESMFGEFGNSWFERWTYTQGRKLREEPAVDPEVLAVWKSRSQKNK